jgi:hypothetical protein
MRRRGQETAAGKCKMLAYLQAWFSRIRETRSSLYPDAEMQRTEPLTRNDNEPSKPPIRKPTAVVEEETESLKDDGTCMTRATTDAPV